MSDDAKKPERWDFPTGNWGGDLGQAVADMDQYQRLLSDENVKGQIGMFIQMLDRTQKNLVYVLMLIRAMRSAQMRIDALESELATVTGRPPPTLEPQEDWLKVIESLIAGATRGGLKALLPSLAD